MSYVSNSESERNDMLKKIGVSRFEELIEEIPASLILKKPLALGKGKSEFEVVKILRKLAAKNKDSSEMICFMGGGAYDHYIPAAVDALISRSEFFTAYTPYQAEVSQGTLQGIYEFQSLVSRLTGMEIANASMYDGASGTAEAVLMSLNQTGKKKVYLAPGLHPAYKEVIDAYTAGIDFDIQMLKEDSGLVEMSQLNDIDFDEAACVIVQSPNFFGLIENIKSIGSYLKDKKAMFVVVANPMALTLLTPPGEADADIAVGEMHVFGNGLNYGGPYVGYFAAQKKYMRKIPGRISASTEDVDGQKGYVLTLQTREQHIRRDKATSNICTNQALCALASTIYMTLMGEEGINAAASESVRKAHYLAEKLASMPDVSLVYEGNFFNEFVVRLPIAADDFINMMEKEGILAGIPLFWFDPDSTNDLLVAVTEKRSKEELDAFIEAASKVMKSSKVGVS
jgi:glycine dehydrogenase subunit 1